MRSMVLRIFSAVLCVSLLITCASCGDSSDTSTAPASQSSAASEKENDKDKISSLNSRQQSYAFMQNTKVKIMPLGDSLTQGGQHDTSAYRSYLWELLKADGFNIEFVGSHNWSYDTMTTENWMHSGYGGATVEKINTELPSMAECDPDIVLLMIGRNDTREKSAEDIVNKIDTLIVDELYKMFPDTHIFLANPPPCRVYTGDERLNTGDIALNEYLPAYREYVEQKRAEGAKISFVDMSIETTGIIWQDFTADDFVHPLPSGYEKLAVNWYNNIKETVSQIQSDKEKAAL